VNGRPAPVGAGPQILARGEGRDGRPANIAW
jgi:hypothetical protein